MEIKIFQADSFTGNLFEGNPAAVCPLDIWLSDTILQKIAAENNLSETAFFVEEKDCFDLRWFTPRAEVDLCGHATLATAAILFERYHFAGTRILFKSRSGNLTVTRNEHGYGLNFPADHLKPVTEYGNLAKIMGKTPDEVYEGREDLMLVYKDADTIAKIHPDFKAMEQLTKRGIIITAPGKIHDFVSRFFAPAVGINEDPVTGSAHTTLTPYWASKLNKTTLTAHQASARGGELFCKLLGDRVEISGQVTIYREGMMTVPDED